MTAENIGIFLGESGRSSLIIGFSMDLDKAEYPEILLTAIDERLKKDKIIDRYSYLHYSDPSAIRQDVHRGSGVYDIESSELKEMNLEALSLESPEAYAAAAKKILIAFDAEYGEGFTEDYLTSVQESLLSAIEDKRKQEEINRTIPSGTAVYLRKPDAHPSQLNTTAFDPNRHDARKVLEASKVASKPVGALEIFPMPPSKSKYAPKFWGHFKGVPATKVHFTGGTQRDIKLKAAVHEAWEKFFEEK